jgi:Ca-activated chloride channel family protein
VTFASPYLLFGLVAVPLAAIGYWIINRRRARRSAPWSRQAMLPNIVRRPSRRLTHVPFALFLIGLTFLLVGFARPERVFDNALPQPPTIVIAMDVSGSMDAADVAPTRIRAARDVAAAFVHRVPSKYRIALVTFGSKVQLLVAPTLNHGSVIAKLPRAVTPRSATGIGDAVSHSVAVIVNAAGKTGRSGLYRPGAILLLSDGGQTAGGTTPQEAAVSALVDYIPVDTIVFGTPKGNVTQPVKLNDLVTSAQFPVPVQPVTLQTMSQQTNGTFFEGADVAASPDALKVVYKNLHSNTARGHRTHALNQIATLVAFVFVLAGLGLSGLWFGRVA